jgi:Nif-specific regulatory protein
MINNPGSAALPHLVRTADGETFSLDERLTTIGSSPQCTIPVRGESIPEHLAHILFSGGAYSITVLHRSPPVCVNGKALVKPVVLCDGDTVSVLDTIFEFRNGFAHTASGDTHDHSPLRRFIHALSQFSRGQDSDIRFEMLAGIAQLLSSDGARLVVETPDGRFSTIARYPTSSGLDRFSERALLWAKQEQATVLMHETDWNTPGESKGSLELNRIGSVLCIPISEGDILHGYLYLDKKHDHSAFTQSDKEILDDVGPLFGDLLALYERSARQQETIARLQEQCEKQTSPIIYQCDTMQRSVDLSVKFAATDSTVLVTGETGTGKELFARLIHEHSNRSQKAFFAINCGAIPENLIESELFGHERGAFTGAHQKKTGLFERADGGTVFLDEIGEMPLKLQVKLLRVLQEAEFSPIGSTTTVKVDVRVVAATNRDLTAEIRSGNFREDLFYRLNVLTIAIPPLRERDRDVLLLADFIIKKYAGRFGIKEKALSLQAQALLLHYPWPGNIRQLENILQKALLIAKGNLIVEDDIDIADTSVRKEHALENDGARKTSLPTLKDARATAEKQCIIEALKKANGNVSVAARLVDTDRKWLTKLMKLHGIEG